MDPSIALLAPLALLASAAAAQAGDPPLTRYTDPQGVTYQARVWSLPMQQMTAANATVARRHIAWSVSGTLPAAPVDVTMMCPVAPGGQVGAGCDVVGLNADSVVARTARRQVESVVPRLAGYPAVGADAAVRRYVRFPLRIDPATRPAVNLDTGEMVAAKLLPPLFKLGHYELPPRFARDGGTIDVLCQVQADLSVLCRPAGSSPPEIAERLPVDWANRRSTAARVPAKLTDGRPAAGKRTTITIRFEPDR
ncbi:hypothetical protein [Sphingopyxis sp. RIFCSPHIGHO2_12_FULL_65_19]|uniref:hypothetical protein n=1 Tax=Sphingopyxis sp. RIFCSPHIGHO2_12_FULL_65_19 TaxID=1802172 RepID=UPI0008CE6CCB|nr:hypothetical protein [Sphingopyxis sp. RIFCSPHIGHO2_12_FULL_65_19]OHD05696.1 MAG: hypothetical protein A3E77_16425 [Sphingopyxis sp. RIFCSPHIGHO2_12_FULL_65_19]